MRYVLYDVLQDIMFAGGEDDIVEELTRIELEELRYHEDRTKVLSAIHLFTEGDVEQAALILDELFITLVVEGDQAFNTFNEMFITLTPHSHDRCMGIELPAIHRDAILFWKCDDGLFRSAWPDDPVMHEKAMRAIQEWKSSECSICHGMFADHKLSCPNNPSAPVKIPVEIYPLEELL